MKRQRVVLNADKLLPRRVFLRGAKGGRFGTVLLSVFRCRRRLNVSCSPRALNVCRVKTRTITTEPHNDDDGNYLKVSAAEQIKRRLITRIVRTGNCGYMSVIIRFPKTRHPHASCPVCLGWSCVTFGTRAPAIRNTPGEPKLGLTN